MPGWLVRQRHQMQQFLASQKNLPLVTDDLSEIGISPLVLREVQPEFPQRRIGRNELVSNRREARGRGQFTSSPIRPIRCCALKKPAFHPADT